jgi:uncharacterized membrane protein (DUF106 family)
MAQQSSAATPPAPSMGTALLPLTMMIPLFIFIIPGLRNVVGAAAGVVLVPLIGFGGKYPLLTALLAGTVPSLASTVVRHFMTDWAKIARQQHFQRAYQKEMMDARLKKNTAKLKKLQEKQGDQMAYVQQQQMQQIKSTLPTSIFFIIIFAWMSIFLYEANVATDFSVPWSNSASLLALYLFPAWVWVYMLLSIPLTMVLGRVLKLITFRRKLEELPPS